MIVPQNIGKYEIIEKLGEGASGWVVKAKQNVIHRIVAIKILFHNLLKKNPTLIKRFKKEAIWASSLVHPNIVPIFEIGEDKGLYYYTMQYVQGTPMIKCIKNKNINFKTRLKIFIELCDALSLAHTKNLIHRDLKPHNVIITEDYHPVILDFGIAKSLRDEEQMTQSGHILGSAHYMAPEQADSSGVGTYTDIFALGVMIYEMMTQIRPFEGDSLKDLIIKRLQYKKRPDLFRPDSMCKITPEIPKTLDNIVFKCIEANPKNRYQNANELLKELEQLQLEISLKNVLKNCNSINELPLPVNKAKSYFYPVIISFIIFTIALFFSVWTFKQSDNVLGLKKFQEKGTCVIKKIWTKFNKNK